MDFVEIIVLLFCAIWLFIAARLFTKTFINTFNKDEFLTKPMLNGKLIKREPKSNNSPSKKGIRSKRSSQSQARSRVVQRKKRNQRKK